MQKTLFLLSFLVLITLFISPLFNIDNISQSANFSNQEHPSLRWSENTDSSLEIITGVTNDSSGFIYETGYFYNTDSLFAFDAFVKKKSITDGTMIWTKIIGGTGVENFSIDTIYSFNLDMLGKLDYNPITNQIVVMGRTNSTDFPITPTAYQSTLAGESDIFLCFLNTIDGSLDYASYFGGSLSELNSNGANIHCNKDGNIYLVASTKSDDFPTTPGAYQQTHGGQDDIIISKWSPSGDLLISSFFGDTANQIPRGIYLDNNDKIFVSGLTTETPMPLPGYQQNVQGDREAFVLKFDNNISQITGGSYIGGEYDDDGNEIVVLSDGTVVLCGTTISPNFTGFPIHNAQHPNYLGAYEGFVTKLSNDLTNLLFSTYIPGARAETANTISIDDLDNIYIGGTTSSNNEDANGFPVLNSFMETFNFFNRCTQDAYVYKMTSSGTQEWATYYGGYQNDFTTDISIISENEIALVGYGYSKDLLGVSNIDLNHSNCSNFSGFQGYDAVIETGCPATREIISNLECSKFLKNDVYWSDTTALHHMSLNGCGITLAAPDGCSSYQWFKNGMSIPNETSRFLLVDTVTNYINYNLHSDTFSVSTTHIDNCNSSMSTPHIVYSNRGSYNNSGLQHFPHQAEIIQGYNNIYFCNQIDTTLFVRTICNGLYQWQMNQEDIEGETNPNYSITEPGCYRVIVTNPVTGCSVYSQTVKVLSIEDSYVSNIFFSQHSHNYTNNEECISTDTLNCFGGWINIHLPICSNEYCYNINNSSNNALSFQWYVDDTPLGSSYKHYIYSTAINGNYYVDITYNDCTFRSDSVFVSTNPSSYPWIQLTNYGLVCDGDVTATLNPDCEGFWVDVDPYYYNMTIDELQQNHLIESSSTLDVWYLPDGEYCYVTACCIPPSPCCDSSRITSECVYKESNAYFEIFDFCLGGDVYSNSYVELGDFWGNNGYGYGFEYYILVNGDYYFTITEPGTYYADVEIYDSDNYSFCAYLSTTFEVYDAPITPPIISTNGQCIGDIPGATLSLEGNIPSGYTLEWHKCYNSSCYSYGSTLSTDSIFQPTEPGKYFAVFTIPNSPCPPIKSNYILVDEILGQATINNYFDPFICESEYHTITASPCSNDYYYVWYHNNSIVAEGYNLCQYSVSSNGTYYATIESSCGLPQPTQPVSFVVAQTPEVSIQAPEILNMCYGDTIEITTSFSNAFFFSWKKDGASIPNEYLPFITITEDGVYSVLVTGLADCESALETVTIIEKFPTISNIQDTICEDSTLPLFESDTFPNENYFGCDSIIFIERIIQLNDTTIITIFDCDADPSHFEIQQFEIEGSCDSIVKLNYTSTPEGIIFMR